MFLDSIPQSCISRDTSRIFVFTSHQVTFAKSKKDFATLSSSGQVNHSLVFISQTAVATSQRLSPTFQNTDMVAFSNHFNASQLSHVAFMSVEVALSISL